jgi:hypothetical protein
VVAFLIDFLFRVIERTMAKPATGTLSRLVTSRRRRHVELIAGGAAVGATSAAPVLR